MEEIWDRCSMVRTFHAFSLLRFAASSQSWSHILELYRSTFQLRIYTKPQGQMPDYDDPVILHSEAPTIEEFCNRLHKGIMSQFSFAWCVFLQFADFQYDLLLHVLTLYLFFCLKSFRVWGRSAKHQPQRCGKDHLLCDEDIVQIVKKVQHGDCCKGLATHLRTLQLSYD